MNREKGSYHFMQLAISEARKSNDSDGYHVGAVIVRKGHVISRGYSDENNGNMHAEEIAIMGAKGSLEGTELYVTMEPCSERPSGKTSCTDLIIGSGIVKVVYGLRDPQVKIRCMGVPRLAGAGIQLVHMNQLEKVCRELSPSLFDKP